VTHEYLLQTLPLQGCPDKHGTRVAKASGFSLHAGVGAEAHDQQKLERLCCNITRPAMYS
jgi:hypothetical protein